jgi:hypothetical protein
MAQRANDANTAILIWKGVYETVEDKMVKQNAIQHIAALRVDQEVPELERRVAIFRQKTGHLPSNWYDLVREGLLRGVPADPTGHAYKLMPDGSVQVEDPESLPFIIQGLPPGWKKSSKAP